MFKGYSLQISSPYIQRFKFGRCCQHFVRRSLRHVWKIKKNNSINVLAYVSIAATVTKEQRSRFPLEFVNNSVPYKYKFKIRLAVTLSARY